MDVLDFSSINESELAKVNVNYLQLKEDETHILAFNGFTEYQNSKGEKIPAIDVSNDEGKKFVNANTVLVDECKKLKVVPCIIKVVTGKYRRAKSGGTYLDLDMYTLAKNL